MECPSVPLTLMTHSLFLKSMGGGIEETRSQEVQLECSKDQGHLPVMELLGKLGPPHIGSNEHTRDRGDIYHGKLLPVQLVDKDAINKQKEFRADSIPGVLETKLQFVRSAVVIFPGT